jgi:hypothetical protein
MAYFLLKEWWTGGAKTLAASGRILSQQPAKPVREPRETATAVHAPEQAATNNNSP